MFGLFGKKEEVEEVTPISLHMFPKDEYNAYWEIVNEGGVGNFVSTVRVYSRDGSPPVSKTIRAHSMDIVIKEQNKFITEQMKAYKK
jgi:hypothetical protein